MWDKECLASVLVSVRRWAAKTLLNTCICQAPSLHFSALLSHPQQPTVQQQVQVAKPWGGPIHPITIYMESI